MKFILEIDCDNEVFDAPVAHEHDGYIEVIGSRYNVAREVVDILLKLTNTMGPQWMVNHHILTDRNGNTVGKAEFIEEA